MVKGEGKRKMKLAVLNSHRCHILKCILNSDSKASLCTIHNAYTIPVLHFASLHGYIDWKLSDFMILLLCDIDVWILVDRTK